MKTLIRISLMIILAILTIANLTFAQDKPWNVPESASKIKNPLKNNGDNVNLGKSLYVKHCKSCHGKSGEGDGTKAEELETYPGDFTSAKFQAQTDGAIFYKSIEGRDDMPSFKKKIDSDEDLWAIIHYVRTLKTE